MATRISFKITEINKHNTPVFYDENAMDKVTGFLEAHFSEKPEDEMIVHELESEYVHADVMIMTSGDNGRTFATLGMGAREMNSPLSQFKRVELIMMAGPRQEENPAEKIRLISEELQRLCKFPFRANTWLGPGHTINTSKRFKEAFGYDDLLFIPCLHSLKLKNIGEVSFLLAIPIYRDERAWVIKHKDGSSRFLEFLMNVSEEWEPIGFADVPRRQHILPEE